MKKLNYLNNTNGPISIKKNMKFDLELVKSFFKVFKPKWSLVLVGGGGILLVSLLQIPGPFLSQYMIDHALPQKNKYLVFIVASIILALLILNVIVFIFNRYILAKFREKLLLNMRLSFFNHILSLPVSFFKTYDSGYILSRLTNDTSATQGVFADNLLTIASNILTFVIGVSALFYIHWKLALISIIVLPFYIFGSNLTGFKIRKHSPVIQENAAQIGRLLGESFLGVFVIKIFAKEKEIISKFEKILEKNLRDNIKMSILNSVNSSFSSLVGGLGSLIVLWYGILEIINGHLTIGKLIAFNAFLAYLYSPLSSLIGINAQFQRSAAAISRIFEILNHSPEFEVDEIKEKPVDIKGLVSFQNVSFSYNSKDKILENINFNVERGELIAIVGRSGAGKTSLVNLIPRFYDPLKGRIFIDNLDIKQIPKVQLRKVVGYVPQDAFLFEGTILDNIKFSKMDATDEEVFFAAKATGVDDIIKRLSIDYSTNVGVLGTKLSGGQKQLISMARVLLKDPKILIFDEATSNLDYETENLLKKAIDSIVQGRTTFVIAHRLTTVLNADRIFVLEKGKLIEVGNHDELYKKNGTYAKLFDEQFSGYHKIDG